MFHWKKVVPGTFTPSAPTTPDAPAARERCAVHRPRRHAVDLVHLRDAVLVALGRPCGPEVVGLGEVGVGVDDAEAVEPGVRHRVIVTPVSVRRASAP